MKALQECQSPSRAQLEYLHRATCSLCIFQEPQKLDKYKVVISSPPWGILLIESSHYLILVSNLELHKLKLVHSQSDELDTEMRASET